MGEWRVYLGGEQESLNFLAKQSGAEWLVCCEADRFYITHPCWTALISGTEVHTLAKRLCDNINLVMSFLRAVTAKWEPVWISAVQLVNDVGDVIQHAVWADFSSSVEWTAEKPAPGEEPRPIGLLARALEKSPDLIEAISLLGQHGDNWTQIYNVIELVERAKGGAIPSNWMSKKKVGLLKQTAQFRETAGESARHRNASGKPPQKPMLLAEAQTIARLVVLQWLDDLALTGS